VRLTLFIVRKPVLIARFDSIKGKTFKLRSSKPIITIRYDIIQVTLWYKNLKFNTTITKAH